MHRTRTTLRHTFRTAAVTAGSLLLLVTGTTPAHAEAATFRDAHGDMAHGADIWSVRVANGDALRVQLHTRDLVRSYRSGAGVVVFIDTDPATPEPEYAFVGGLFEGTDYALVHTDGWRTERRRPVAAGHYLMRLDYRRDVARIAISRAALGGAQSVRVALRTGGVRADGDVVRDWLGQRRELTPWLARG